MPSMSRALTVVVVAAAVVANVVPAARGARNASDAELRMIADALATTPDCGDANISTFDERWAAFHWFLENADCRQGSDQLAVTVLRHGSSGWQRRFETTGQAICPIGDIPETAAVDLQICKPEVVWRRCSRTQGDRAAHSAGLFRALARDGRLGPTFGERISLTRLYGRPATSLCGDVDRDGRTERAVHYQCCTVSSPAPWAVLRRRGARWRIIYDRLHDTTWKLEPRGADLVTTEPKYGSRDAHCCPSHLRIGTLRWTGHRFKRTFRIEMPAP